ncbi:hypothetical protein SH580_20825 [Coraliomargarita algicola]|uniref:Uncharacterized protein n=1 Tax=Coraliomargarita algicola TaxID=3092156 RepID=A0ABZ0RLA2_9BACT|nr:hypothetical protein [Coraliomargarita sp. J2-16]WPJ95863.1 hypothetical protein SH580_20825 [Coraliomargarita sp. J2-16]
MPSKPVSSPASSTRQKTKNRSRSSAKFIPNLQQLNDAATELPDPDLWPEKTYQCPIQIDGKQRTIEFSLKSINRGKVLTPRWTYEGRILIRKRDA